MHFSDDITARILASLATLPSHEQAEAMTALIGAAIKTMSIYRILEIRQEILTELDVEIPIVRSAIDLIDGQLALREIGGSQDWR